MSGAALHPSRRAILGLAVALFAPFHATASAQTLQVRADRLVRAPGDTVGPALVTIRAGRIASIEVDADTPAGALRAAFVIPGLIDARTTAGLSGLFDADDDTDDTGGPIRPELRAEDGFDLHDPLLRQALRSGVTIVQAGPGDANSIGGQAGIFRTAAPTVGAATVRAPSALLVSLAEEAKSTYAERNRLPTTRMANVGLIRQALLDAAHHDRSDDTSPDAGMEALVRVLSGDVPVIVVARRSDEIATALRLGREFDLRLLVAGGDEAAFVIDALRSAGSPVLLEPPDPARLASGEAAVPGAAAALHVADVPFALVTGDVRSGGTLLDFARAAVRAGLPADAALAAITTTPARLLGIEERAGSVATGRPAHLVLLDGDPFDATARVLAVVVGGAVAWRGEAVR